MSDFGPKFDFQPNLPVPHSRYARLAPFEKLQFAYLKG